jgi:hypothetical protein
MVPTHTPTPLTCGSWPAAPTDGTSLNRSSCACERPPGPREVTTDTSHARTTRPSCRLRRTRTRLGPTPILRMRPRRLVGGIMGAALPVPMVGTLIGARHGALPGLFVGDSGRGVRCSRASRRAGGGCMPVLGDHLHTRHRCPHHGHPVAGCVLLRGSSRAQLMLTWAGIDAVEEPLIWDNAAARTA